MTVQEKFNAWVKEQEAAGLGWTAGLPAVPNPLPHKITYKTLWGTRRVKIWWFWVWVPYSYQVASDTVPVNPDSKVWTDPIKHGTDDFSTKYHPGAVYELRSRPIANGAGQQACYDANFNLITTPHGWGSKDKRSPSAKYIGTYNVINVLAHLEEDVNPFSWAYEIDGNTHGSNVETYMKHRPPSV